MTGDILRASRGDGRTPRSCRLPRIHTEIKRKGVTLQLLWSEHVAEAEEGAYATTSPHSSQCAATVDIARSVRG